MERLTGAKAYAASAYLWMYSMPRMMLLRKTIPPMTMSAIGLLRYKT